MTHAIQLTDDLRDTLAAIDCWAPGGDDLQRVGSLVIGDFPVPLLRRGNMIGIAAGRAYCSSAAHLEDEFAALATQCNTLRNGGAAQALRAAAFFMLRLQKIHPMTDGNGRIGRLLLAEQSRRAFAVAADDLLQAMHTCSEGYRAAFAAKTEPQQFDLMVAWLARVASAAGAQGVAGVESQTLPFPLAPLFPEQNPPRVLASATPQPATGRSVPTRLRPRSVADAMTKRGSPR